MRNRCLTKCPHHVSGFRFDGGNNDQVCLHDSVGWWQRDRLNDAQAGQQTVARRLFTLQPAFEIAADDDGGDSEKTGSLP
jgi:hypothetical protein